MILTLAQTLCDLPFWINLLPPLPPPLPLRLGALTISFLRVIARMLHADAHLGKTKAL